jgi:ADP-ribosyl-[dinitrogen reductase] hydrolase
MKERIKGSLLGLAWGDIFGCPVEGWRKPEIIQTYGVYRQLPDKYPSQIPPKRKKRLRPLGLHSDDTQQSLALIYTCLQPEGWKKEVWSEVLVKGLTQQAWRGTGRNFTAALHRLKKGIKPEKAGSPSSGMGAAMRVGPLGALFWHPSQKGHYLQAMIESTLVTHADQLAAVFAAVVGYVVRLFVQGKTVSEVWQELPTFAEEAEEYTRQLATQGWNIAQADRNLISQTLMKAVHWIELPLEEMRLKISEHARPYLREGFTRAHPNQGFVLLGGLHALLMASREGLTPQEALQSIINEGFDTDTVASIAGAILGARAGMDWIPKHLFCDRERILAYADALCHGHLPEGLDQLLQAEANFTKMEKEFQQMLLKENNSLSREI